jgi:hypothetical protein
MASIRPIRILGAATVGVTAGYSASHYWNTSFISFSSVHAESPPSDTQAALKKMIWKGFTELKLAKAEMVNHNVRKLTFALPDEQSAVGLAPISKPGDYRECLAKTDLLQHLFSQDIHLKELSSPFSDHTLQSAPMVSFRFC